MSDNEVTSPPPPGMSAERWERLTRAARTMDIWRQEGSNKGSISASLGTENEVIPAPLATVGDLANPDLTGADDDER